MLPSERMHDTNTPICFGGSGGTAQAGDRPDATAVEVTPPAVRDHVADPERGMPVTVSTRGPVPGANAPGGVGALNPDPVTWLPAPGATAIVEPLGFDTSKYAVRVPSVATCTH